MLRCLAVPEGGLGYAYTNTRVRVMKSKLLSRQDFEKMMKMSVPEIARFLSDSEYKREVDEMGAKYEGVNLIEYALNRNMSNAFRRIHDFALRDSRVAISLYLKRWDVWNIKTILRGKQSNSADEEIFVNLVPAGEFRETELKRIISTAQDYGAAVKAFSKTEYAPILEKHASNPEKLEDELDRYYYKQLLQKAPPEIQAFVKKEIDIINFLGMKRAKDTEMKFIPIPGGADKPPKLEYKDTLEISAKLKAELLKAGSQMLHTFKRNVRPVMGYFVAKESEIRNIRILARGKHAELSPGVIESNLVM
jgi:V/A-type H+-transporting ATPase subunit C